jgi:hypothetical protein
VATSGHARLPGVPHHRAVVMGCFFSAPQQQQAAVAGQEGSKAQPSTQGSQPPTPPPPAAAAADDSGGAVASADGPAVSAAAAPRSSAASEQSPWSKLNAFESAAVTQTLLKVGAPLQGWSHTMRASLASRRRHPFLLCADATCVSCTHPRWPCRACRTPHPLRNRSAS